MSSRNCSRRDPKYNKGERVLMKLREKNYSKRDPKYTKGEMDFWNSLNGIGLKGIQNII